jgi:hypothetical protein
MRAPAMVAGLPDGDDGSGRRGYVWHLSIRNARGDRTLTDSQWAEIAREMLDGAGVAGRADPGGPRWVAIRHAEDHIHVAAVLVRQDTGRRFWPHNDWPRLRRTARKLEDRLQLTPTAPADRTAAAAPGRAELGKAQRQAREPARVELARVVRLAAVSSINVNAFASVLRGAGYLVELRYAPSGDVIGYKVARPGDLSSSGNPIFYSGSKLAPDLSMPRLHRRWEDGPVPAGRTGAADAQRSVRRARRAVAAARARGGTTDAVAGDIVGATGDLLLAVEASRSFRGQAADTFDRASRVPRSHPSTRSRSGSGLRHVARQMIRQRYYADGADDSGATVALAVALAALVREVAEWHRDRGRAHQASAAKAAAATIDRWPQSAPSTPSTVAPGMSAVLVAGANRYDEMNTAQADPARATTTLRPRASRTRSGTSRVPRD